jgi:transcriptional regulator with PAS, ATPase and Fis domain
MVTPRTKDLATLTTVGGHAADVPSLEIVAASPRGSGTSAVLALTPVVVGKGTEADIVVSDAKVSRLHCSFSLTESGIVLRDLGSKNGTYAAGVRVVEALLTPGAIVMVGDTSLTVRVRGAPSEIPLSSTPRFGDALGATIVMRALFAQLEIAARSSETILLLGESGTGKELLARGIHARSPRSKGPFVIFDSGAVAKELVESELFGFVRGAFTGAHSDRAGVLEQAHGGTLFLDEIGELPLPLQPKLLRALETRQFRRVGGNDWRPFDTRVVAATHRHLSAEVRGGTFREDLYYRIAVVQARVPPLRERRDDIELLVSSLLAMQAPPRNPTDLPPHALAMLKAHDWPGNVRELKNTLARLILFPHLGHEAFDHGARTSALPTHLGLREAREQVVEEFEQAYLLAKLREHAGNVSRAADAMGVSRQFVHRLMDRYGIRGRTT